MAVMGTSNVAGVGFETLLDYLDEECARWELFFRQHPDALRLKMDIGRMDDVAGLLHHIFAAEFRFAQRIHDESPTPWQEIPRGGADSLFRMGRESRERLRQFARAASDARLDQKFTFKFTSIPGEITTSYRKWLTHAIIHGVRHWAQLAVELRKCGYSQDWQHDFLFSKAME